MQLSGTPFVGQLKHFQKSHAFSHSISTLIKPITFTIFNVNLKKSTQMGVGAGFCRENDFFFSGQLWDPVFTGKKIHIQSEDRQTDKETHRCANDQAALSKL